jgi:hypothetical protein
LTFVGPSRLAVVEYSCSHFFELSLFRILSWNP